MIDQVSPAAAIRLNLSNPSARNAHDFAQLDKFEAFEAMLFSVFDGPGFYRAKWRAYKLQDGRTAADICRAVKRSRALVPIEIAMLCDEPGARTFGQVALALLAFYEHPQRLQRRAGRRLPFPP